jgi:hypothetical protein
MALDRLFVPLPGVHPLYPFLRLVMTKYWTSAMMTLNTMALLMRPDIFS